MKVLAVRCVFVAQSYGGVRLTTDRREVLDWPPAPARLHQALLSVLLKCRRPEEEQAYVLAGLDALRWLERQAPPEIVGSALRDDPEPQSEYRGYRLAIPQNNRDKDNAAKSSVVLARSLRLRLATPDRGPLEVAYVWRLEAPAADEAGQHLPSLSDLTAQLRYFGRAEDAVEAAINLTEDCTFTDKPAARWLPNEHSRDLQMYVAGPGTTDSLIRRHTAEMPARMRRPSASRFFQEQEYARDAMAGMLPVHVSLMQLTSNTSELDHAPLSCDPDRADVWRNLIRRKAVEFALDQDRWDDPDFAEELITGHVPGSSSPTRQPHLSFVPVPSISTHAKADGRVRRFALLGYATQTRAAEATAVYSALSYALNAETFEMDGSLFRLELADRRPEPDRVWPPYTGSSRVWWTVTPVGIARRWNTPTCSPDGTRKLSESEKHLRLTGERTALVRASLKHAGLPEDLIARCSIALTASPLLPNTERAERYRPLGEPCFFTHARFEFSEPVRGPLIVGDRRYQGFGLCFPGGQ
ncbi:MAG: type I-G CRISPR-associated protein Csb2 [Bryobacteraceae bacterium]